MKLFFRASSYCAVFAAYLFFMNAHAPLGISWMDFHAERVFNAVEFLRLSGLENFGYTVWSLCDDCVLENSNVEGFYGTMHGISLSPYIFMNHYLKILQTFRYILLGSPVFLCLHCLLGHTKYFLAVGGSLYF